MSRNFFKDFQNCFSKFDNQIASLTVLSLFEYRLCHGLLAHLWTDETWI